MRFLALTILLPILAPHITAQSPTHSYDTLEQYHRPGNTEIPTPVYLGIYVVDILEIADVERTVTLDYFLIQSWSDPRLADDQFGNPREKQDLKIEDIWNPRISPVNIMSQAPQESALVIDGEGNVLYRERKIGSFTAPLDLRRFPFDKQTFKFKFVSTIYGPDQIDLQLSEDRSGHLGSFSLPGWTLEKFDYQESVQKIESVNRLLSGIDLELFLKRESGFYIWKVFIPLGLIAFMAWTVFWIDPAEFQGQVAISSASVITLIAFQLSLSELLPKISYLTEIDFYALATSFLVFMALGESILTARLAKADKRHIGLKIDHWMRFIYPVVFAVLILSVVF